MEQAIYQHTFDNGLTLLAERMEHVRSAAMNFLVPAGCVYDPPDKKGIASLLSDLLTRGAGELDSRQLTLALDNLGVDHSESVGVLHTRLGGATVASNLFAGLSLFSDILRRPQLPAHELDAAKALALQDLRGLEDEPTSRLMVELRRRHHPAPLGNDSRGVAEHIESMSYDDIRAHYARHFTPHGTIISVAGNVDWDALRREVERLFGDWKGEPSPTITLGEQQEKMAHITKEGLEQTHIAIAFPSVPVGTPYYYPAMGAVNVLSGNMSSRLFTELREKEGLCYSVHASYQTFKDRGSIICYVGTRTERANRSLEKLYSELDRLKDGIEQDEVDRVQAGLKSSLIMQQESTGARAGSLASDWYYLGRVRRLDEIQKAIDDLSPDTIVDYVKRYPPKDFTVVTLGPTPLEDIVEEQVVVESPT